MRRTIAASLLALSASVSAQDAREPNAVDLAEAAYNAAEFEAAQAHLRDAVDGSLTRSDVVRLLVVRSLVGFATGDFGALERDLLALVTLQPEYALGVRAPPPMHDALDRLRAQVSRPLGVRVELTPFAGGVRLQAVVTGDASGFVETITMAARNVGGAWRRAEGDSLMLPTVAPHDIEYYAEARGPGDAVLARDGAAEAPQQVRVQAPVAQGESTTPRLSMSAKAGIAIGAAALVAAVAVLIAVLLRNGDDSIRPQGPFLE